MNINLIKAKYFSSEKNKKLALILIAIIVAIVGSVMYLYITIQNDSLVTNSDGIIITKTNEQFTKFEQKVNNKDINQIAEQNDEDELDMISKEESKICVHVDGCVVNPGIFYIVANSRVKDAIDAAGGVTEEAVLKSINLAEYVQDEQKIYVPSSDESMDFVNESFITNRNKKSGKININLADINELQMIDGIGQSTANKIIQYRSQNGKFSSIEELKNISGIGDKKFELIKDEITV